MKQTKKFILCIIFLCPIFSAQASPSPCANDGIASRYKNADLVVIGQPNQEILSDHNLRFKVEQIIKGNASSEITLQGQNALTSGTDWNGFSFQQQWNTYLLFLHKNKNLYMDVEPFNSGCYRYFPLEADDIIIDDGPKHPVKVRKDKIKEYLESNPKPFTYN